MRTLIFIVAMILTSATQQLSVVDNRIVDIKQPIKVNERKDKIEPRQVAQQPLAKSKVTQTASSGGNIEQIIRVAARKYGINEEHALRIARCESGLNPNAVNRNYYENGNPSGLYQHLSGYFPARAAKYGYAGASVFDPVANANVTMAMWRDGQANLWECR